MKHRVFLISVLCLALLLTACQQVAPPSTDGTTESSQPAHTHSYTASKTVLATCTEDGHTVMTCTCGLSYNAGHVKALGHDHTATEVVKPTATEIGYTVHTCTRCGDSYQGDQTDPIAPTSPPGPTLPTPVVDSSLPTLTADDFAPAFQPMSYEDYFAEDRKFSSTPSTWYIVKDGGYVAARIGLDGGKLAVLADGFSGSYIIPGSETLRYCTVLAADGIHAYLRNGNQILRLHLLTGETTVILTAESFKVLSVRGNHVLLYYVENGGILSAYRMYLPTLQEDLLWEDIPVEWENHNFHCPPTLYTSTQTELWWTNINPDMLARLKAEHADPNSPYREKYPPLWEGAFSLSEIPYFLIHDVQTGTGIPAWIKGTYSTPDGTSTRATGVIDTCWYGSGYGHDHYDPNYYDVDPTWAVTDPVSIPNLVIPENASQMYEDEFWSCTWEVSLLDMGDGESKLYTYRYDDELRCRIYTPLAQQRIKNWVSTKTSIFCITRENTLIQLMPDGTSHVIYEAKNGNLRRMMYGFGRLYCFDGDMLMEIDIPAGTCMQLMKVEHFSRMYLDEARVMYIDTVKGLSVGGYTCNFNTQSIREGYRL